MRVSDQERQRVIDELRRHCAAGRLDVDEYADRIEQALSAASFEDLDRALGDLPMLRIADPSVSGRPGHDGATPARLGLGPPYDAYDGSARLSSRFAATAVVLISVMVVVAIVVLLAVASWTWAALLFAGWLLGVVQTRLSTRPTRRQ
jgi:hypothetical protein